MVSANSIFGKLPNKNKANNLSKSSIEIKKQVNALKVLLKTIAKLTVCKLINLQ